MMTQQEAIALYESHFWEDMSDYQIAVFQLSEERLCIPFRIFHGSVEAVLGRPVYTHELMRGDHLLAEIVGTKEPPTLEQIIAMIPAEKRVILTPDLGKNN